MCLMSFLMCPLLIHPSSSSCTAVTLKRSSNSLYPRAANESPYSSSYQRASQRRHKSAQASVHAAQAVMRQVKIYAGARTCKDKRKLSTSPTNIISSSIASNSASTLFFRVRVIDFFCRGFDGAGPAPDT